MRPPSVSFAFAFAPLLVAPVSAWLVTRLSGPEYTTAVNQGALVVRFLWIIVFPILTIPLVVCARLSAPPTLSRATTCIGIAAWLSSCYVNYLVLEYLP